ASQSKSFPKRARYLAVLDRATLAARELVSGMRYPFMNEGKVMRTNQMRFGRTARIAAKSMPLIGALVVVGSVAEAQAQGNAPASQSCPIDSGITLPPGFCATVFADNIGHARQLVVAPNGVVYANTWSGRYYGNDTPPPGGMLVALQDTKGNGHADAIT